MATTKVPGPEGPVTLHYDVFANGDRPWLAFAHGAGGNALCWWQQVPVFFERYNIVTFDHRAFGRSRCSKENFEPGRFPDDLADILDAVGAADAGLVCQSMGGWTGLGLALAHPERVWALVMSHTTGGLAQEATRTARERISKDLPPAKEPFGSWAVAHDFPDKNPRLSHLYRCMYNLNVDFLSFGGVSAFADRRPQPDTSAIAEFKVPTLFVTGELDTVIPREVIEAAHAELPEAELVNLGAVGHSSYFEAADAFNEVVGEFLRRHAPA